MFGRTMAPVAPIATAAATLGLFAMVATGAHAASKPPVKAKTVTACVNTKSGATKVLLGAKAKKKCAKGWSKVRWSVAGKNGANGSNGSNGANGANGAAGKNAVGLQVRDSAGTVLGTYAGMITLAPYPVYVVLGSDGGIYNYLADGQLWPSGILTAVTSPVFLDSTCAGTAYANFRSGPSSFVSLFVGHTRFVYRPVTADGSLGTPRTWKYTSTTIVVPSPAPTYYQLDFAGTCAPMTGVPPNPNPAPVAGNALIELASTPAPPDGVGTLTLSLG